MKVLCAIANCPNPAPGKVRIWCKYAKKYMRVLRNVCQPCIEKIWERYGIK
jgi:hypothetical protein